MTLCIALQLTGLYVDARLAFENGWRCMPLQQDQEGAGTPSQLAAREYFGARAERYRQSAGHGNAEVLAQIVQFADLQGDEFVFDIST